MELSRCRCGRIIVVEVINLKDGDNPFIPIAKITRCSNRYCKNVVNIELIPNEKGVDLYGIQGAWDKNPNSFYTMEEIKTSRKPIVKYNPDQFHEQSNPFEDDIL